MVVLHIAESKERLEPSAAAGGNTTYSHLPTSPISNHGSLGNTQVIESMGVQIEE